jgi:hypothetical protein
MKKESSEQITFIQRVKFLTPGNKYLVMAIPNGGKRGPRVAAQMKAEGVLKGAPDVFVAIAKHGYYGLFIEMKRLKGGKVSDDQIKVHAALRSQGYKVVVCKGAEEAWNEYKEYVND